MNDFKSMPLWKQAIPVTLGVGAGLYGAATANKLFLIVGMPLGFIVGFVIVGLFLD